MKFVAPLVWDIMLRQDRGSGADINSSSAVKSPPVHLPSTDRNTEDCQILLAGAANEPSRAASAPETNTAPLAHAFVRASSLSAMPTTAPLRETSRVPHFRQLRASVRKATSWSSATWRELEAHLGAGAPFLF